VKLSQEGQKKRILWVTFHFPPRLSGGVFRPIRIYKHLDKELFEIDFVTISMHAAYRRATRDDTLLKEVAPTPAVYRVPSLDPESWLRRGADRDGKQPAKSAGLQPVRRKKLAPEPSMVKRVMKTI
jgi:hypothetical protein